MYDIQMSDADVRHATALIDQLEPMYESVEDGDFLRDAPVLAHELPRNLRRGLSDFRLREVAGICRVSGFPVDDGAIGPTPPHWDRPRDGSPTLREEMFFFLCASLVGDPIAWSTQQAGYVMHDLTPIRGHETEQLGTGSEATLTWHTEEAFHPYRADYISLMCLRNPDAVETTFASIEDVGLEREKREVLFEPRFRIRPDKSHLPENQAARRPDLAAPDELLARSYRRIAQMWERPEPVGVLFGDTASPYLRVDPYFMDDPDGQEAEEALGALIEAIDRQMTGVALQPGEILFIDNFRVVHGRRPFRARFDGTDRWLKRLNVARDLRKSRDARVQADNRVIF